MFSQYTTYLANRLCGGSSRKLIAGWWYSILAMTISITIVSLSLLNNNKQNRNNNNNNNNTNNTIHSRIIAIWSSLLLCIYCIGGTMIMRKFHNSLAVGFFMGVTITSCQYFIALSLLYLHYRHVQLLQNQYNANNNNQNNATIVHAKEETFIACLSMIQAILLGTFAIILAAHRTEILDDDKPPYDTNINNEHTTNDITTTNTTNTNNNNNNMNQSELYQPPISSTSQQQQQHIIRT